MKTRIMFLIGLVIVLPVVLFFSFKVYKKHRNIAKGQILLERRKEGWLRLKKTLESKVINFRGTAGIVVEDLDTGRKIVFNENTLIPSASLVKVPIMLSCFYAAEDGKISLKDAISLKSSEKVAGVENIGERASWFGFYGGRII